MRSPIHRAFLAGALPLVLLAAPASTRAVEIGADDFRISSMGGTGDYHYAAAHAAVAYNSVADQYLVVWHGDHNVGGLVNGEKEIFGQLLDSDGHAIGNLDFRISDLGGTGDYEYDAQHPAVAYNSIDNQYLVVWRGDDTTGDLVDEELEIFGQLLDASGNEIGNNDFRISDLGGVGNGHYDAENPVVAYNSTNNEYLVVWEGDDDSGGLVNHEDEIWGQRLAADGSEIGANDFRISDMGGTGDALYQAHDPALAYNSLSNEYLVVWWGDDNVDGVVEGEHEIFTQRLSASGIELGANDLRISDMGGIGTLNFFMAYGPAIAHNSTDNRYLVVWTGEDDTTGLAPGEWEIFGQQLTADGSEIGANDRRISFMGPSMDPEYDAEEPTVTFNKAENQYLVVWHSGDDDDGMVEGEEEVFCQVLDMDSGNAGVNGLRISSMGGTGDHMYNGRRSAAVYNSIANRWLVVWDGVNPVGGMVDNEGEVFGQLLELVILRDGFESGDTSMWTAEVP